MFAGEFRCKWTIRVDFSSLPRFASCSIKVSRTRPRVCSCGANRVPVAHALQDWEHKLARHEKAWMMTRVRLFMHFIVSETMGSKSIGPAGSVCHAACGSYQASKRKSSLSACTIG